jgi:peptidoglycan/xylan/chitin deacetylase (PgdA/CDA1 family)
VLPLEDVLSTGTAHLPERAVALTFDDGYEDNLRVAAPLLQRYGAPATCFLTTAGLDSPIEYWWDTLERLLLQQTPTPARLDMNTIGMRLNLPTGTIEERRAAHWQLHDRLVHAPLEVRNRAIDWLHAWAGKGTPRVRPMVADEVRQLSALSGVTIGAHTVNHLALPDIEEPLSEITDCQASLRRLTGCPVDAFAYPYGSINRETAALVRRSWRWGLSCDERVVSDSFDAARVPRLDVKAWTKEEFATRLLRFFESWL